MNQLSRHELDAVIDRVAERMVAVPEDSGLMARTITQLPERRATPWFLGMRVQLAAAASVVLVAFLFARPSRELPRMEAPNVAATAPAVAPIPQPRSPIPVATPVVVRQVRSRRAPVDVDRPDHERSLAPVAAIDALELVGIAPLAMELDATAAPEALVVPELALDTKGDS